LQVGQPERAADILAAKWSADDSAVGHDDVELIGSAGAQDYVPHIVTGGLVSERVGDHSGVQRAIDRAAGAEWTGPLPHGFASLDSAIVSLSGHLPSQRSADELERYVEVILRDESSPLGGRRNLTSLFAAAQGLYWLGRFDEAVAQCESVLRGHRSVGRHTTGDQVVTVLAACLRSLLEHDLGNSEQAWLQLAHSDELARIYGLDTEIDHAPSAWALRALATAVVGRDPYPTRAAELTRLMIEREDGSIRIHSAIELVRLLDQNRHTDEALEALEATAALIGENDIPPLLAQRLGLLEQALRGGSSDAGPSMHVTPSERSVLYLLADRSLAQNEISERLGLSINTVKSHLRSIYQKFGVAGRSQAVEHARRQGLLVTVLPWGPPS
ncbi:MAG: LuxR C-terminal-related transcriptional regulator, partial [Acidimicrobiales bacterium]